MLLSRSVTRNMTCQELNMAVGCLYRWADFLVAKPLAERCCRPSPGRWAPWLAPLYRWSPICNLWGHPQMQWQLCRPSQAQRRGTPCHLPAKRWLLDQGPRPFLCSPQFWSKATHSFITYRRVASQDTWHRRSPPAALMLLTVSYTSGTASAKWPKPVPRS